MTKMVDIGTRCGILTLAVTAVGKDMARDAGCWMLDTGCWMLDRKITECMVSGVRCRVSGMGRKV